MQPSWAPELVVGYARLDGRVVGIVANQPKVKGGVLFVDSADKAARFIWTCNAFNVPLLFLADVPGFMIGSKVEREGIIRARREDDLRGLGGDRPEDLGGGAQVLRRRASTRWPGPAFEPDCCLALPTAQIAVMGPEAAINAVFYNQIQAIEDPDERAQFVRGEAGGVRGRHRHPAPGLGAGRGRRDRARVAAGRAGPPVCPLRGQGPRLHDAPQRRSRPV